MVEDARFEDGAEKPLRLKAQDADDLVAISAVLQDAVLPVSEMQFQQGELLGGRRNLLDAFCDKLEAADISVTETANGLSVKNKGSRLSLIHI